MSVPGEVINYTENASPCSKGGFSTDLQDKKPVKPNSKIGLPHVSLHNFCPELPL